MFASNLFAAVLSLFAHRVALPSVVVTTLVTYSFYKKITWKERAFKYISASLYNSQTCDWLCILHG